MPKLRNDSIAGKKLKIQSSKEIIEPILPMNDLAQGLFGEYLRCRPSYDWSPGDLVRLTALAERAAEVFTLSEQIRREGMQVEHEKKGMVPNPLLAERDRLERTVMAMESRLSVYAPRKSGENLFQQAKEENAISDAIDEDLLG